MWRGNTTFLYSCWSQKNQTFKPISIIQRQIRSLQTSTSLKTKRLLSPFNFERLQEKFIGILKIIFYLKKKKKKKKFSDSETINRIGWAISLFNPNMENLKITKKHHKHLNNPFPSTPISLPFIQGTLFFNSQRVPSHQIFSIGKDFQLLWSSNNGGCLSIFHNSNPSRSIWSTIPGQAFVSAALAETEVEESRGSFLVKDGDVHLVCNHQTIEDIRVINQFDHSIEARDQDFTSGYPGFDQKTDLNGTQFPILQITGWIYSMKKKKKQFQKAGISADIQFEAKEPSTSARYCVLFNQKNSNQIGFQVMFGQPSFKLGHKTSPTPLGRYCGFRRRLGRLRKRKLGFCWYLSRPRGYVTVSSAEEEIPEMKVAESTKFNRVCLTYSSEAKERFYGFGEQFSHMDFKGKRVPIFVQEQGIGRGDQPITFAANLVSYR